MVFNMGFSFASLIFERMTKKEFGVLFDMDGVIVDSNPAHKEAIHIWCGKHGIEVSEEFMQKKIYGRTNKEWIPELMGELGIDEINNYADEKEKIFRDLFKSDLKPVTGIVDFISGLKADGIKTVLATSAPGDNAEFILHGLGIYEQFNAHLDSSHVEKGKPEPEVYQKAAKAIDMAPENCVVIEDSLAGVQAGKGAGCKVVGVTTTHTREELSNCDLVVDDFSALSSKELGNLFPD